MKFPNTVEGGESDRVNSGSTERPQTAAHETVHDALELAA